VGRNIPNNEKIARLFFSRSLPADISLERSNLLKCLCKFNIVAVLLLVVSFNIKHHELDAAWRVVSEGSAIYAEYSM
jgi:hypothetical protein